MRLVVIVVTVLALIVIGTADALISNDQLSQLPGRARPSLTSGGATVTVIGVLLSAAIYVALGVWLARDGARDGTMLGIGIAVGAAAGFIGGAVRAYLIRDYLGDVLAGYGLAGLLVLTLAVFVALSVVVSVAAGAGLTWLGFRGARRRPSPRPQS